MVFKKGDRVILIEQQDSAVIGTIGTIISKYTSDNRYNVEIDREYASLFGTHNCDGECPNGRGYRIRENCLAPLDAKTKTKLLRRKKLAEAKLKLKLTEAEKIIEKLKVGQIISHEYSGRRSQFLITNINKTKLEIKLVCAQRSSSVFGHEFTALKEEITKSKIINTSGDLINHKGRLFTELKLISGKILTVEKQLDEIKNLKSIKSVKKDGGTIIIITEDLEAVYKKKKYNIGSYRITLIPTETHCEVYIGRESGAIKVKNDEDSEFYVISPFCHTFSNIDRNFTQSLCFGSGARMSEEMRKKHDFLGLTRLILGVFVSDSQNGYFQIDFWIKALKKGTKKEETVKEKYVKENFSMFARIRKTVSRRIGR